MEADKQSKQQQRERKPREKSIVISFRLSESAYAPYKEPVEKSGLARSEFFRQLFSDNTSKVVVTEKKTATEDYNQYLHLVNKISNNINQLARLLNGAEKSGNVTAQQYLTGLNNLNSIRLLLNAKLGNKE
ncbi:mobilisation protein (MobC) [Pseudomonas peli]|uniref:Mobilisation protein (MobC) n=1 Tax=Pseudomonas peli TaxID=592361 RepID=A0AB37ZD21_9PSED|nr:plasmid mobilization relaxosome protein MobC [Pseudomonas peli]NMZ71342.1 plasmid mobilization relaxosome protein MobC [Pseudomonas peli]SCW89299.1 mobilisation protein (MobC) [Pseudomonas peli]